MSVTITQVRRAVEEAKGCRLEGVGYMLTTLERYALSQLLASPTALTLIANSINQKLGADLEQARENGANSEREFPRSQSWT